MARTREKRRLAGALRKGLGQARFDRIEDPRDERGKRWKLATLLGALVVCITAGSTNLRPEGSPRSCWLWLNASDRYC